MVEDLSEGTNKMSQTIMEIRQLNTTNVAQVFHTWAYNYMFD